MSLFVELQYPLCTLLVFDSRKHALPVAWVITRSFAKPDMSKWMKALHDRARSVEPGWKVSGFLIDDAAAETDPIRQESLALTLCFETKITNFGMGLFIDSIVLFFRDIFCCPVLFSLWRVRRSWLRNIVKKCNNIEVQREIFKRLGKIVYSIWDGVDTFAALEELAQDFVDQTSFMEYFKASWVPKIGSISFCSSHKCTCKDMHTLIQDCVRSCLESFASNIYLLFI